MWILAGDYRCIGVGCSTLLGHDGYKRTELERDSLRDELTRNLKAGNRTQLCVDIKLVCAFEFYWSSEIF
ncbi:hypothetical protein BDN70DRAFT_887671 [Pholiota conissans]|uniref:Uncharacterized protein n=1 Tax=Pholiota conissans TaxID=109636 RepID=A0A9P5YM62_9AGAR|nr:hypothetical protein BDN70DRAFT_887671 [Pholiota conissans]